MALILLKINKPLTVMNLTSFKEFRYLHQIAVFINSNQDIIMYSIFRVEDPELISKSIFTLIYTCKK